LSLHAEPHLPIRRLVVLLDHVAPTDGEDYRREIAAYRAALAPAYETLGLDGVEYWTDHDDLPARLRDARPEFVVHLAEYGYKGSRSAYCCQIPALLDAARVPYSNADCAGMIFSSDKHLWGEVCRAAGVPVPVEAPLHEDDVFAGTARVPATFPFPAFLKTRLNGGSVGIAGEANRIEAAAELPAKLRAVLERFGPDDVRGENMDEWLLQEWLPGPEYSVAIVGNGASREVLPIGELGAAASFLTYDNSAEVVSGGEAARSAERYVPARLAPDEAERLREHALRAFNHLAFRDYARFDFRRDASGVIKLIDANALPGVYPGSAFVTMAAMRGQGFAGLMQSLLFASFDRLFLGWRALSDVRA